MGQEGGGTRLQPLLLLSDSKYTVWHIIIFAPDTDLTWRIRIRGDVSGIKAKVAYVRVPTLLDSKMI